MGKLADDVLDLVCKTPGLTDRELTKVLQGIDAPQQGVNDVARHLAPHGLLERKARGNGLLGNYPTNSGRTVFSQMNTQMNAGRSSGTSLTSLSEDDLKGKLKTWLEGEGWSTTIASGRAHGIDIDAKKADKQKNADKHWIIEVKGSGSRQPMRVNYFLAVLGEILQHMSDPEARYSIALPDLPQFRPLWRDLPALAKKRIGVSLLLVQDSGQVEELTE